MTICALHAEMFADKDELRRDVIEGHGLPVLHGVASGTAQIRNKPVEHTIVLIGMTRFAADVVESEHRFLLTWSSVAIIARDCSVGTLQWESRVRMFCHRKK